MTTSSTEASTGDSTGWRPATNRTVSSSSDTVKSKPPTSMPDAALAVPVTGPSSPPAMPAKKAAMENTSTFSSLVLVPWASMAVGESAKARRRRPIRLRRIRTMTARQATRHDQHDVVVADVGVGVEPAGPGPGRGDHELGAEHEHRRVEEPLDHQAEAERGDGQVHAGQADGGDGQQRPDGDGHQPADEDGRGQGTPTPTIRAAVRRSDRGEGDVAQRRLAGRPHQQAERGEQDHVGHRR